MIPLALDDKFHYFHFDSSSRPPLETIEQIVNQAWVSDYAKRKDAVFEYDIAYIDWLLRPESYEGVWVTTPTGRPAGLIILTKRTICTNNASIPAYYGSLFSVVPEFRKQSIGKRMYELVYGKICNKERGFFGVMDGDSGGLQVSKNYKESSVNKADPQFDVLSEPYTIWAACKDIRKLHSYMPLPTGLLNFLVRKVIEFRFQEPRRPEYRVSLVDPSAAEQHISGTWFKDEELIILYGTNCVEKAGTYRVQWPEAHCDISYIIHKVIKDKMPATIAGHLQLIRNFGISSTQMRKSIKVVTNKLLDRGAIAVLVHHTHMVKTRDLLQAGFLPSGRKIKYYYSWHPSIAASKRLVNPMFWDLL